MFWKKKCNNCGSRVSKNDNFCPHCGEEIGKEKQGLLDEIDEKNFDMMNGFGMNLSSFPFDGLMKKLMSDLDKSFRDIDKQMKTKKVSRNPNMMSGGLSISITSNNGTPQIKVKQFGDDMGSMRINGMPVMNRMPATNVRQERHASIKEKRLTKEQESILEKIQKTEPQTSVRRLSNKIVYEIDLPGVKEKDVIINKLQNSIEIKAFAKDKVFFKLIPISLPILRHSLEKGKLILELKPEM